MISFGEIFFTFFYLILCYIIILKLNFFKRFTLSQKLIGGVFLFKVIAGIAYGLIHYYIYNGGDTFGYFNDAQVVRKSLHTNPLLYLKMVFDINTRPPAPNIIEYARAMSYWNDMSSYFIIRFHSLAGLITFEHYYANVIIYNFLTMIGILYLFQFIYTFLPEKKYIIAVALFIFPSINFWASGIHKDGISLSAIGLIMYFISTIIREDLSDNQSEEKASLWKQLLGLSLGVWLLFVVRDYLLMLLTPCVIAYIWTTKFPRNSFQKSFIVLTVFYLALFNMKFINIEFDLLDKMSKQQEEFSRFSSGETDIVLLPLNSDILQLFKLIPQAVVNCLLRPSLWNFSSLIQLSSALDNFFMLFLLLIVIFFPKKTSLKENPLLLFSIFFAVSVFIFVGSIVPNIGALVRYKMPGTLFLAIGILSIMDVAKIKRLLPLK